MKAGFSIKLILYIAPNCPRRIVAPNCPRRIVQRRIVRAELSAPHCPAPNCPGTSILKRTVRNVSFNGVLVQSSREIVVCLREQHQIFTLISNCKICIDLHSISFLEAMPCEKKLNINIAVASWPAASLYGQTNGQNQKLLFLCSTVAIHSIINRVIGLFQLFRMFNKYSWASWRKLISHKYNIQ